MAEKAGLTVPPVKTLLLGERRIMLIRRFDRYWMAPGDKPVQHADLLNLGSGEGRVEHRSAFVSGLTLVACGETESRNKSYRTWPKPFENIAIRT
jgi:serine/threonine-protein kinase HipA